MVTIKSNMKHGYSIIEVLLAGVIFALAASGVSAAIMFAQRSGQASAQQAEATRLAEEAVSALNMIRTRDYDDLVVAQDMALNIDQGQWVLIQNPTSEDDVHQGKTRRISITEVDGLKTADITVTFPLGGASTSQGQVTLQETYTNLGRESIVGVTGESQNFRLSDQGIDSYEVDLSPTSSTVLGEVGRFTALAGVGAGADWYTVEFTREYGNPIVIGTANSEDPDNPANVFEVRNVTLGSAEMRLCNSRITANVCDDHAVDQIGGYVVVDLDRVGEVDGIYAGTVSISGGGNNNWIPVTTSSISGIVPRVFTTVQDVPGNYPLDTKVRLVTSTNFEILLCHMTNSDNCAGSYPVTEVAWLAIDDTSSFQQQSDQGTVFNVNNSSWSSITFAEPFSGGTLPVVLVENQTNNGSQNGEINSSRLISETGAEVRYCELDAGGPGGVGVCDTHTDEDIAWLALRPGLLTFNAIP